MSKLEKWIRGREKKIKLDQSATVIDIYTYRNVGLAQDNPLAVARRKHVYALQSEFPIINLNRAIRRKKKLAR